VSLKFRQEKMARGRGQLLQRYRQYQTFDHKAGHIARVVGYRPDERYAGEIDKAHLIREGRSFISRWRTAARNSVPPQQDGAPTFPDDSPYGASGYEVVVPGSVSYAFFPLTLECGRCRTAYELDDLPEPGIPLGKCPRCSGDPHHQLQHVFVHQCGVMTPFRPPARCSHCSGTFFKLDMTNRFRDFRWICQNVACKAPQDISRACGDPNCQYRNNPMMRANVHTASEAYIAHSVKVVNPPAPEHREKSQRPNFVIATVGHWLRLCDEDQKTRIIEGNVTAADPTMQKMLETLRDLDPEKAAEFENKLRPFDADALREAIARRLSLTEDEVDPHLALFATQLDTYERTHGKGRIKIADLKAGTDSASRKALYDHYNQVLSEAGFTQDSVFLVPDFPVIELAIGYSRGSATPGEADLRSYRGRTGKGQAEKALFYAHPQQTEALVFGLSDERVERWLTANGHDVRGRIQAAGDLRLWLAEYLTHVGDIAANSYEDQTRPEWSAPEAVMRLLHSMAHQFIRALSVDSGFAETSMSEHFFPYHLAFAIYPRARGEFVIGGLRTVLEQNLNEIVNRAMENDQCIYDPNCYVSKGADHGCLFLPETACSFWNRNQHLSRWDLFGGPEGQIGYWSL
jgi:hypothetical protein